MSCVCRDSTWLVFSVSNEPEIAVIIICVVSSAHTFLMNSCSTSESASQHTHTHRHTHPHTRTHAHTHARTPTRPHAHTHYMSLGSLCVSCSSGGVFLNLWTIAVIFMLYLIQTHMIDRVLTMFQAILCCLRFLNSSSYISSYNT